MRPHWLVLALVAALTPAPGTARERPGGGLVRSPSCPAFAFPSTGLCTHGPDARPRSDPLPVVPTDDESGPGAPRLASTVACEGDGTSGLRVQLVYARAATDADLYDSLLPDFRAWAANMDSEFAASAAETGGVRRLRFVTDPSCEPVVSRVVLSVAAMADMDLMILELADQGFDSDSRKYLVWAESDAYCGIGTLFDDDLQAFDNTSNVAGGYARVDRDCWGLQASVEAHELMHTLGGVQNSSPHSTSRQAGPGGHCSDEADRMCYADFPGVTMTFPCASAHEAAFDCNHDDYFSTAAPAGGYLYTHWNTADSSWLLRGPEARGRYVPVPPRRILDTRDGTGGVDGALGQGGSADVTVVGVGQHPSTGLGGVPPSGATAAVLNVTVTGTTAASYLTVWPSGQVRPGVSSLNWTRGVTVANLVVAPVGQNGKVSIFNAAGSAHVVFDVAGWYWDSSPGAPGRLQPLVPYRALDTRSTARLGPGGDIELNVAGVGGVPADGASGVVANVTVTNTTADSYLTIYTGGRPRPASSNLNWVAGQTVPNRVMVLADTGRIRIFNASGFADVVVDLTGWVTDDTVLTGFAGSLEPVTPARILDTRDAGGPLGPNQSIDPEVTDVAGIPATASAVVLNVTVTNTTAASYLTISPTGEIRPHASDLNWVAGLTVPNLVLAKVGVGGRVNLYNPYGSVDVVLDVVGWYD